MSSALEKIRKQMEEGEKIYLGAHTSPSFARDPKHLLFTLARYKFVAKMFSGKKLVCEIGCGDGFGLTLVSQVVDRVLGIDLEAYAVENRADNIWLREKAEFLVHDILERPLSERFPAIFSLDVIEHIEPEKEDKFFENIVKSSTKDGALIIGTPNATAAAYASLPSQIGHINLKTFESLNASLQKYYEHVFMFGMNDEVVHTGFGSMSHYLFGLAVVPR